MRYMGGKARQVKHLAPILIEAGADCTRYIEPFVGSACVLAAVAPHFELVEAGDIVPDLALFWSAVRDGWQPPDFLTRDEYDALRTAEPSALRAFAGFGCSFAGKWFGGYGSQVVDARHPENHVSYGSAKTTARKRAGIAGVQFHCRNYAEWTPGPGDLVYCDPPYAGTTGFRGAGAWDVEKFWEVMRLWVEVGARVFVSEYAAPDGWTQIWERETRSTVQRGDNRARATERLFTWAAQAPAISRQATPIAERGLTMPEPEDLDNVYGLPDIPRDRFGRPLVVPPEGGKPTAYTRCTTYVGVLEDTYNLSRWQQRMVALGLAKRPDLVLAAAAHHDDKDKLNDICSSAMDAAAAGAAAGVGTALHKLTERMDRGEAIEVVPEAYAADLAAYAEAMKPFEVIDVERFVVNDELKVGGTPDKTVIYGGKRYVADTKTGSIEWGAGKIAMQLAMYSRSAFYDHVTKEREPVDVDLETGIVIHLPAGEGRCELHWVDLTAGWEAIRLAGEVRAWRARRKLMRPFDAAALVAEVLPDTAEVGASLLAEIETCSVADLKALFRTHRGGAWTDEHTRAAGLRKERLLLLEYIGGASQVEELNGLFKAAAEGVWTEEHTRAAKTAKTRLHQAPLKRARAGARA